MNNQATSSITWISRVYCHFSRNFRYWKCHFPTTPPIRPVVGRSVIISYKAGKLHNAPLGVLVASYSKSAAGIIIHSFFFEHFPKYPCDDLMYVVYV